MDHQTILVSGPELTEETFTESTQLPRSTTQSDLGSVQTASLATDHVHGTGPSEHCEACDTASRESVTEKSLSCTSKAPDDDPEAGAGPEPRLALTESLGVSGLFIILGGVAVILASVAFLVFLWFGAGSPLEVQNAPWAWRRIALRGYSPQAVTIIALVFRAVVVSQSTACTSMIAALILERSSVPKPKAASFSIARATNNGPLDIISLILLSRNWKSIATIESFLLLLLLLETTGLQFSSTILLSDLRDSAVLDDKTIVQLNTFASRNQQSYTKQTHLYRLMSPNFPVFGEWPSNNTKAPQDTGLSETGIVSRAFLPFSQSKERISTRSYKGSTTMLNSNTACMRPELQSFRFIVYSWQGRNGTFWGRLNATLDYDLSIQNAKANESCGIGNCSVIPFSCDVVGVTDGYGWQSSMCFLGGVGGTLWPLTVGPREASVGTPWSANSSIYLILATNMRPADWLLADELGALNNGSIFSPEISDYEEWRSYRLLPDRFLNASLCFQAYNLVYSYVQMETIAPLVEPNVTYDQGSGGINTLGVQRYFGADPEWSAPGQRGILQISQKSNQPSGPNDYNREFTISRMGEKVYEELVSFPYTNYSTLSCYHCTSGSTFAVHPDLIAVLGNIFNSTSRAVDLLQTYTTSIVMTLYYESLRTFTVPENVTLSSVQTVVTAHGCRDQGGCSGFTSVVTLLAVHLTVVLIITARFIARTRYSRNSSVWCAVAQLDSKGLQDMADKLSRSRDKDVERAIKQAGNDELVKIGRIPNSRRVGIIKHQTL
ncbi:hypothetical protein NUW58_g5651 [Xylaria curta]|uniref:Uncharacterized protein n=1 Tax=Xylaria curta TaxID=42375 RepID=A0ACC1P0Q4_9PEZI|nr:hypothetical protein NUW58_g5651 [Xylaria curta]